MRIYQLEGFYYVGRTGGYAAAARAMPYPVGEPAVHQQVRRLEEDLDVRLVRRDGRRILLTPEGRALHEFVAPYFEGLAVLDRRLRSGRAGTVAIAATSVVSEGFLPERLARLRSGRPELAVRVLEFVSFDEVLAAVDGGRADFGITHFPRIPTGFRHAEVGWIDVLTAVPRGHPLVRRPPRSLEEIAKHPLVAYERGSFARAVFDEAFRRAGLTPSIAVEASSSVLQVAYVRAGLGIALIPRLRRQADRDPGVEFRPAPGGFPSYRVQAVWKAGAGSSLLDGVREALLG